MFRRLVLLGFILFTSACANPDYLSPEELNRQNQKTSTEKCTSIFPVKGLCLEALWVHTPSSTQVNTLEILVTPPPAEELSVQLWMPSMGHGSAPVKIHNLGAGHYRITNIYFIMPGDWDVRLFLRQASGETIDQLSLSLMVP